MLLYHEPKSRWGLAVTVGERSIHDVTEMSAADSLAFFEGLSFEGQNEQIAGPIVKEIKARLRFLVDVGLDYLTLERATATLSGTIKVSSI